MTVLFLRIYYFEICFVLRIQAFNTGNIQDSVVVQISFLFSLLSIVKKAILDDKECLDPRYQKFAFDIIVSIFVYLNRI